MTMSEMETAFLKLRLYWKYITLPANIGELCVKVDMLLMEPDSAKKFGLLAIAYLKLANAYMARMSTERLDYRPWINIYCDLYMECRAHWFRLNCPSN